MVASKGDCLLDTGHARLNQLGYKQELNRDLSVASNFAFSFSIISVLTGITTLYNDGLNFGGPVWLVYEWIIAGVFTMFVGLSMAEILLREVSTTGVPSLLVLVGLLLPLG